MATKVLNRDEFRAWLQENSRRVVGYRHQSNCCPLACFLQKAKGKKTAQVGAGRYTLRSAEKRLPLWAKKFVSCIDNNLGFVHRGAIRGATALRILDAIAE